MDKQTHTKFNLNNFLMAFSDALDNTIPDNPNGVKFSSKSLAYISIKLALEFKLSKEIISDIFSYSIICKNTTFVQNIDNIPFNDKNFLDDINVQNIISLSSFIINNIKLQDNTIINEKELKNIINDDKNISNNIKNIFNHISKNESFWYDIMSDKIAFYIFDNLDDFTQEILFDDLIQFTAIVHDSIYNYTLRDYKDSCIDFKAFELCNYFNFENKDKARFIIASHLHNIGLLFISKDILNKPSRLNHSEFQIIKQVPYFTHNVLQQVYGFDDITKLCFNYMEKIDGSGYPNKIDGTNLSLKDRLLSILSAYQALSEKRTYRDEYKKEDINNLLRKENYDEELINIL
jgi:HD-GYP domain-containing protein (c-di-GMP phosphodiesterase class II)